MLERVRAGFGVSDLESQTARGDRSSNDNG